MTRRRQRRVGGRLVLAGLLAAAVSVAPALSAVAAKGDLTQPTATTGCVSETGTGGLCVDGKALAGAFAIAIAPGGAHAYVASIGSDAIAVLDRDPVTGALAPRTGTAGCVSDTGSAGACADGNALTDPVDVAVSPDGKNVYVAAYGSSSVLTFDRDPATGAISQKPGGAGCAGAGAGCASANQLTQPSSVTVAPNGADVYVTGSGSDSVAAFTRNPATGAITQKSGTSGCITNVATAGCASGAQLDAPWSVVVSPDGANAYVASQVSGSVTTFDRDPTTGALVQKPGASGCLATGSPGCTAGRALFGAIDLAFSPDGRQVYAASSANAAGTSDAVAVIDRSTTTGTLTQKTGPAGCVSESGGDGASGACADGVGLQDPTGVAVAPDGSSVYVASHTSSAVAVLDRTAGTGALAQKPGARACISEDGTGGACTDGRALAGSRAVTVGPGGASVYVASNISDAVAVLSRQTADPDTTPPKVKITKAPKAKVTTTKGKAKVTVKFTSEPGAAFACKVDKKAYRPCSSPFKVQLKAKPGKGKKHTISVVAADAAGNKSAPAKVTVKVVRKLKPK